MSDSHACRAPDVAEQGASTPSTRVPTPLIPVSRYVDAVADADVAPTGGHGVVAGGLQDYLAGMSLLAESSGRQGPGGLAPSEVRRLTGSIRAVTPTRSTGSVRALTPSRATSRGEGGVRALRSGGRTRLWIPLAALLVMGAYAVSRSEAKPAVELPPPLLGEWVTADARYAGRRLTIEHDRIRIAVGGAVETETHDIRSVRTSTDRIEGGGRYEVEYGEGTERQVLRLTLFTGVHPELRLENPYDVVWIHPANVPAKRGGA